jgi:hypothetical protein
MTPLFRSCPTHSRIVSVVAFLAESSEIQEAGCLRAMIENMGRGKHHNASGYRMRFSMLDATPFAFTFRSEEADKPAAGFPVSRVARAHFRTDRHQAYTITDSAQLRSVCSSISLP